MLITFIVLVIVLPVLAFVVWLVFADAAIRIEPGTVGLVMRRGKATDKALEPGRHFVLPFRKMTIQSYPSRELSLVAGRPEGTDVDNPASVNDFHTTAVPVTLGDRSTGEISYTLRVQMDLGQLKQVHERFGPEGIWAVLRDESRRVVIDTAAVESVGADDMFGERYLAFERELGEKIAAALAPIGFVVTFFNLRGVDLGLTSDVVQSTVRTRLEIERERARAELRRMRMESDADLGSDLALQYRQLEAWQDLTSRWTGAAPIPGPIARQIEQPIGLDEVHGGPRDALRDREAGRDRVADGEM